MVRYVDAVSPWRANGSAALASKPLATRIRSGRNRSIAGATTRSKAER